MFVATVANRDRCQAHKETHKQKSRATHMTHFKRSAVNPKLNNVSQKEVFSSNTPLSPLSSPTPLFSQQRQTNNSFLSLSLQQPQNDKSIYSLNLTQTAHSLAKPSQAPFIPHTAKPLSSSSSIFVFLGTPDRPERGGHVQRPPISPDHISIPPLHPLPPSPILPHSLSHLADAVPIYSPPRNIISTTPLFLGILPDSDKCNGSQFV